MYKTLKNANNYDFFESSGTYKLFRANETISWRSRPEIKEIRHPLHPIICVVHKLRVTFHRSQSKSGHCAVNKT